MPTPEQNRNHFLRLDRYSRAIDAIYQQALREASGLITLANYNPDKPFSFDQFPLAKKRMDQILSSLTGKLQSTILSQEEIEWNFSNAENDDLVKKVFKGVPEEKLSRFNDRNLKALKAFQNRKDNGIGLSDRIWSYAGQMRQEMEMSIDLGLADGRSAQQLSQDVRRYLNDPDKLFRRVRDKRGNLQLSKNAKAYHPGRGKYRSSYKNAMRTARTEVNMSYRMADHERRQQMPFITGFEVKLSNNHPVFDICDDLKGKYPKDFVFRGWHPQCRCNCISILASREELSKMTDQVLAGEDINVPSSNQVNSVPDGFNTWVKDNRERAKKWKSQPYFVKDNPVFVRI